MGLRRTAGRRIPSGQLDRRTKSLAPKAAISDEIPRPRPPRVCYNIPNCDAVKEASICRRSAVCTENPIREVFLEAYGRLIAASEKLKALEKEVLLTAQDVYDTTSKGYAEGKFDLLHVLDAQRTLFDTRLEIINTRAEFQKAKVQIEALIGRGLYDV